MGNAPYAKYKKLVPLWLPHVSFPYHEKVALIVEPREHINLMPVVTQMNAMYPDWFIYLFHGKSNTTFVHSQPELVSLEQQGRLVFIELQLDNLKAAEYNALFTTRAFWEGVNAKHALVFQTDSWLCAGNTTPLDSFLEYDYVGAPVEFKVGRFQNGGFSLRNVEAMKRTIDRCAIKKGEDVFFSRPCKKARSVVAPPKVAQNFAGQQKRFDNPNITPVGLHVPWKFYNNMEPLESKCPGITAIKEGYTTK